MAPTRHKVLINCDMGEAYGNYACGPDEELVSMIDIANVACGFHAGDPVVMARTVALCKAHGVKIGAHPGLPDVQGFGRREMKLSAAEHTANVVYQVGALRAFVEREGLELHHVKPHGVLYGLMARDAGVARAVWAGVAGPGPTRRVFGLAGTAMETAAREAGLEFWAEHYGDAKYRADGSLVIDARKQAWRPDDVRAHVRQQLFEGSVTAVTGEVVARPTGEYPVSVCCHSDSPGCGEIIRAAREVVDEFNASRGL
ncbi:lamB/YcsF family protein [Hirsutella rhossiliensis]|uniref:LamB/YcsF family domain-containing protein n=1 Tax=Hirsutella rhossiliensis TaxID=111463 RepID=A0A9P8MZC2_9HYPO|nr:lamB/YcsF family domain-containing protein [Hirsutella rhossiliensis]KAH0965228.1 lamB/YcsF family domain-containing protein [Hirsutella rhossiliensis]